MEGWTTESVLKKHNLWRELAGPHAGATAVTLQWQDMKIARLMNILREMDRVIAVYADLPKDRYPGPPPSLIEAIRSELDGEAKPPSAADSPQ
jgi:hypothetical protein